MAKTVDEILNKLINMDNDYDIPEAKQELRALLPKKHKSDVRGISDEAAYEILGNDEGFNNAVEIMEELFK